MKLYATTTSERASSGQGGNQYIDIELKGEIDGNRIVLGKFRLAKEYDKKGFQFVEMIQSRSPFLRVDVWQRETKTIEAMLKEKGKTDHCIYCQTPRNELFDGNVCGNCNSL
jgi:hypothetical protein